MNKYKENLIALCEALEIVDVEEFIEESPEHMTVMGEYITENCKWYKKKFDELVEQHPHTLIGNALINKEDESDSPRGNENPGSGAV